MTRSSVPALSQPARTSAAANAAARVLAEVLRAENAHLAAGDANSAALLLPQKQAATQALQAILPDGLPDSSWAQPLRELAAENRTRLAQAIEVQSRIVEMVARAARQLTPGPTRYGRTGNTSRSITAMALALRA